jgi:hypothetical protein
MSIAHLESAVAASQSRLFDLFGQVSDLALVIGCLPRGSHAVLTLSDSASALPEPLLKASKHGNSSTQDNEFVSILA